MFASKESMVEQKICPKHDFPLAVRENHKTGEVALACPLCDVEQHGGSESDVKLIRDLFAGNGPS